MKNTKPVLHALLLATLIGGCGRSETVKEDRKDSSVAGTKAPKTEELVMADAKTILERKQVPVLCYHQIRDWRGSDSKSSRDIIVPLERFKEHMKVLADSGYQTILPDDLYNYLAYGKALPPKPVMLTYDDTDIDQYTVAAPEMKKYGFKGVFFIMTVSLNRPRYMSREQVKELANDGHVIASHTWDHHKVTDYDTPEEYAEQIEKPKKQIEDLTGKSAEYFAYPYGLWKKEAIPELQKRGVKAAYILSTKRDEEQPLYTIRRMIGSGNWSGQLLYKNMMLTFANR